MILLFTHKFDHATKKISEWLHYYDKPFMGLNEDTIIQLERIELSNIEETLSFAIGNRSFLRNEIMHTFFRGGSVRIDDYFVDPNRIRQDKKTLDHQYVAYVSNYSIGKMEYLTGELNKTGNTMGINALGRYNKLFALKIARHVGLKIPDTLLTTHKSDVINFFKEHGSIITKSIDIGLSGFDNASEGSFQLYTSVLNEKDINDLPETFALSKFQKAVVKRYELRVFFLKGVCYTAAIISQSNQKTQTDYRRYDTKKMNRLVPYKISETLASQINKFMQTAGLDTGSLDFIKDKDGDFVFLEVNPIGQFGYVSDCCNYHLHKIMAETLIETV